MPKDDEAIADFLVAITAQIGELSQVVGNLAHHVTNLTEEPTELRARDGDQNEANQDSDNDALRYH